MPAAIRFFALMFVTCAALVLGASPGAAQQRLSTPLDELASACGAKGGHAACVELALRHREGSKGAPRDPERAASFFVEACKYGDRESCWQAVLHYDSTNNMPRLKDALVLHCKFDATMCLNGWSAFSDASQPYYDPKAVEFFLATGCAGEDSAACMRLGAWFDEWDDPMSGTRVNLDLAGEAYYRACKIGVSDHMDEKFWRATCYRSFLTAAGMTNGPKKPAQALDSLERACRAGMFQTCSWAAVSHLTGEYGAVDTSAAKAIAAVGCRADDADSCEMEGWTLLQKDKAKEQAMVPLAKACRLGADEWTCDAAVSIAHDTGRLTESKVHDAYQAACNRQRGWACYAYAYALRDQKADTHNVAPDYIKRSCRHGYQPGCDWIAQRDANERRAAEERAEQERARRQWERDNPPPPQQASSQTRYSAPDTYGDYVTRRSQGYGYSASLCRGLEGTPGC